MRVIDLSRPIHPEMPLYPGTDPVRITPVADIRRDKYREVRLDLASHTGTHLDAPGHILEDGRFLDSYPAGAFLGPGAVLDLRGVRGRADLETVQGLAGDLSGVEFVILRTGWERHWGTPEYCRGFPLLTPGAAAWLAERGLKGVGLDASSVDSVENPAGLPVHREFLGRGQVIVENLCNLADLPARGFIFSALPLNIRGGDGSPVRAVALLPETGESLK